MIAHQTRPGSIEAALAGFGIGAGARQLRLPTAGPLHGAAGHADRHAMPAADQTALSVFQLAGSFDFFRVAAPAKLACLVAVMIAVLQDLRPSNWKGRHHRGMVWSAVGPMAAATGLVVQTAPVTGAQGLGVAAAVTAPLPLSGSNDRLFRPPPCGSSAAGDLGLRRGGVAP